MSDQGPTVEAPAAPVEAPAAAPEQPAESPLKKESFREAFERHQAKQQAAEAEKPAAAEPAAPKPGKKVETKDPELEQLRALAKKRGLTIDGDRILPSDRAKFRDWEKKRTDQLVNTEKERLSALEKREKEVAESIKQAQGILKAKADGDYQGLAKELGFESWDKLQEDVIARISDPNYKRLRELEQWKADEASRAEQAKADQEKQQAQQQQAQRRQAVYKKFSEEMPQSKDPLVAAMGDHPLFVNAVLRVQEENWDGRTALPYERIAGMAAKGAQRTIREECKDLYDRLHKAFGGQQQPAPAAKPKALPGRSAPVAPSRGTEASPPRSMTKEERNAYERQRLAEAIAKDRANGL